MIRKNSWILLLLVFFIAACSNPLDVDISDVEIDISFVDINHVIVNADSAELIAKHHQYFKDYEDIYSYLIGYCLRIGKVEDSAFYNSIIDYRLDPSIQEMNADINKMFSDMSKHEELIVDGFKHLKYHLPDGHLPSTIVYINSLFNSGVFCTENEIGIGLQQYLGKENEIVKQLNPQYYYDWMKEGFDIRYLERDVLTGWIETHCIDESEGALVEHIVRWGKVLYLAEAAFPDLNQSIILRYTEDELKWAQENEYAFWKYLVDENLLFKIDERTTRNMVGDGPFTAGLPEEGSPARMGQYLGWRMCHSYMEQYNVSVKELIELPYNEILQEFEIE